VDEGDEATADEASELRSSGGAVGGSRRDGRRAGGNGEESGDEEMRRWEDYFVQMK
jgi:hypothetical protein